VATHAAWPGGGAEEAADGSAGEAAGGGAGAAAAMAQVHRYGVEVLRLLDVHLDVHPYVVCGGAGGAVSVRQANSRNRSFNYKINDILPLVLIIVGFRACATSPSNCLLHLHKTGNNDQ
jgi:hypothetical protein